MPATAPSSAATSDDLSVYALDADGNLLWQEELGIGVKAVDVYGSGEKARVVVGSDDGFVTIYSRTGSSLLQAGLDYSVRSVSVSANGARILTGASDGTATMLNGANGSEIWRFKAEDAIASVSIAADGSTALVGSEDDSAYLLDREGALSHRFDQDEEVLAVALAGDGSRLALGTASGAARTYDRGATLAGAARSTAQRQRTLLLVFGLVVAVVLAAVWAARNTVTGQQALAAQLGGATGRPAGRVERSPLLLAHPADAGVPAHFQLLPGVLRPIPCLHRLESGRADRVGGPVQTFAS